MRISDWSSDVCSSDLNEIAHNKTANIIVSSYFSTGFDTQRGRSAAYDPYPQNIYVANNRFAGGGNDPTDQFKPLMALGGGKLPDVVWDGFVDPKVADARICVQNGDAKQLGRAACRERVWQTVYDSVV